MQRRFLTLGLFFLSGLSAAFALTPGTVDTFQDGTFMGWSGSVDSNATTGGPAGVNDRFLATGAGTFPPNAPNLAITNVDARWAGDFTAAGVTRLEADLKVISGPALDMRVQLFGGTSGQSRITSTTSLSLPADGQWHRFSFDVSAANMTSVAGTDSVANILNTVNRVMIRHQSGAPSGGGTAVSAQAGFDNIASARLERIASIQRTNNDIHITFSSAIGGTYRVERRSSLTTGTWHTLVDNIAGTGNLIDITDTGGAVGNTNFYRLVLF